MRRWTVVLALAAAGLAGCGTFSENDAAADVDGVEVTVDEYEALLQSFTANAELTQLVEDPATGGVPGADARRWLSLLVLGAANERYLADAGEAITEADRQQVLDGVSEDDPVFELPDDIVQLLVDQQAGATARARIQAPDAAELEVRYAQSPSSIGVICVRHVLLETQGAANDVVAELDDEVAFETLATERSIDPSAADNGGAITAQDGGACIPLAEARQSLDPTFVAAAAESRPGEPIGPVRTQFGWHVIEARPYDEVAESLGALYEEQAGELLFAGYLATADIRVDPRYGRWDGAISNVVAL